MNTQAAIIKMKVDAENKYDMKDYKLSVPIHKLCGLEVSCKLIFNRTDIIFRIDSDKIYNINENGDTYFTMLYTTILFSGRKPELEDYAFALDALSKIMENITFNRYSGYYETEKNELTPCVWQSILGCKNNIEYIFNECCICHELTKSTTFNCCDKALCYNCWDKLKMSLCSECQDNDGHDCDCEFVNACGTAKCPLCRCSLASGRKYE